MVGDTLLAGLMGMVCHAVNVCLIGHGMLRPYLIANHMLLQAKEAAGKGGEPVKYVVDTQHVLDRVGDLLKKQDLSKFIL